MLTHYVRNGINNYEHAKFDVLTEVATKGAVFRVLTLSSSVKARRI
jgi:hypothetical protein